MKNKTTPPAEQWTVERTPMQYLIHAPKHPEDAVQRCAAATPGLNGRTKEHAEFIVRACNSHEKLLEACRHAEEILATLPQGPHGRLALNRLTLKEVRAAIADAEGR